MMKSLASRLTGLLLVFLLLCSMTLQQAQAAGASLSGADSLRPGDTVTLTFSVSGSNVYAIQATLRYDSAKLSLLGAEQLIASPWTMNMNGNTVVLSDSQLSSPINSSKSVFSVSFKVKDAVSSGQSVSASVEGITVSDGNRDTSLGSASWSAKVSQPLSSNAKLAALSCVDAALSPAFSADTTHYTVSVPFETQSLSLYYDTADSGADISISGNSLEVGENTVTLTVTAADGSTKRYTITATRAQDPNYKASANAKLSKLTPSVGTLSPQFSPEVTDYVIYLPYETNTISISAVAQDTKALRLTDVKKADLEVGDNPLHVVCTAEDGSTGDYTIHVWRMPLYQGTLPQITDPLAQKDTPAEEPADSSLAALWCAVWAALCTTFTVPYISAYVPPIPLYVPVVAAALLLLLLLFLLGRKSGIRKGRRKALADWNWEQERERKMSRSTYSEILDDLVPIRETIPTHRSEEHTPARTEPEAIPEAPAAPGSETSEASLPVTEQPDPPSPDHRRRILEDAALEELLKDIRNM